jgi:hypothetical protein
MPRVLRVLAAAAFGVAALGQSAQAADDMTTATFGGTTIWVGGGVQFLSLPDIRFTGKGDLDHFRRQKNSSSDWLDFGGAAGGGVETALGFWGNARVSGAIKGFWANVEDSDRSACKNQTCIVVDPTGTETGFGPPVLVTKTDRDADYWGGQAELKFGRAEPVHEKPNFYRNDYFIVGADIRGIDQDNTLRGHFRGDPIYKYNEMLDTTYYGGYVGLGGEYSFGFIPGIKNVGGLYDRLGLRTFISARAGLYNADTDYDGRFAFQFFDFNSKLSNSSDDLAFIGTVSLETRKQIGNRTSLSLWTDYEYISSVPKMHYADGDGRPTRIDDESVFASRTMLRLNIGLGSSQLYPAPPP